MATTATVVFKQTDRLKASVVTLNAIEPKRCKAVLPRVFAALKAKSPTVLSVDEETQFSDLVSQPLDAIRAVLSFLLYVYEQSVYHGLSAAALQTHLQTIGVLDAIIALIVDVYVKEKDAYVQQLRDTMYGAPRILEETQWRLHLGVGQDHLARLKDIRTIFNLQTKQCDAAGKETKQTITMELTKSDLERLYENLETMQRQLDALTEKN